MLEETPKDKILENLLAEDYNSNVGMKFDLEECDLLAPIYEKVNETFLRQVNPRCKARGPYNTGIKYTDIIKYIELAYNIKVYNVQISQVRKRYGIADHGAKYGNFKSYPKAETAAAIREALIHFGFMTEESEPITEADIGYDGKARPTHYKKEHATYNEIKAYILEEYGYKVHTASIAEVKREYDVGMINVRSKEGVRHPKTTKEKHDAIVDALYHFRIINEI